MESTTKSVTDDHTPHNPESSGTSEAESKNSLERGEVVAPDTELHTQDVTDWCHMHIYRVTTGLENLEMLEFDGCHGIEQMSGKFRQKIFSRKTAHCFLLVWDYVSVQ